MRTFLLALASLPAFAGGFFVEIHGVQANPEARSKNAVLIARLLGCHEPEKARLTAFAEREVDGKIETIQLKLEPLSKPGLYAVAKQWPDTGDWTVRFIAVHPSGNQTATASTRPAKHRSSPTN